jgi:hypothetical protein
MKILIAMMKSQKIGKAIVSTSEFVEFLTKSD